MEVWIGRNGERFGPYSEADIRQWLREGSLKPGELAWHAGLTDWQPAGDLFPGEAPAAGSATPMPPPPPRERWIADPQPYAGFWKRVAAYIVDVIILWIPHLIIGNLLGAAAAQTAMLHTIESANNDPAVMMAAYSVFWSAMLPALGVQTLVTWAYFALCESSAMQGTPGKLAMGIRVTDDEGRRISFLRATGRHFGKFISSFTLCIGFMMAGWTERKQALHDMMASTLVLNGRASATRNQPQQPAPRNDDGSFSA
ncbi:RDD family protein [Pinirhizobacter soli]|uniref:RDD family protein n=1 Tax=Pinirhizobacter soli TaxID=2786953 RepID=UPI002029E0BD|nr:RDD family protein [Pinirhizobacter soli]